MELEKKKLYHTCRQRTANRSIPVQHVTKQPQTVLQKLLQENN